jgi:hypothetical protein
MVASVPILEKRIKQSQDAQDKLKKETQDTIKKYTDALGVDLTPSSSIVPIKPTGTTPTDTKFLDEQKKEIENATADYIKLKSKADKDKNEYDIALAKESDTLKKQEITDKFTYESDILAEETRLMLKLQKELAKAKSKEDIQNLKDASAKELQAFTDAETAKYAGKIETITALKLSEEATKKLAGIDPLKELEDNNKDYIAEQKDFADKEKEIQDRALEDAWSNAQRKKALKEQEIADNKEIADRVIADLEKEYQSTASYKAKKEQLNAIERTKESAQLAYNQMVAQLSQDIIDGKVQSLGDYAAIIGKQLQVTLTNIAIDSGFKAMYETAMALAAGSGPAGALMFGNSADHWKAAGTFAATAAAAGLGAVAAGGVAHMGTPPKDTDKNKDKLETPTGTDVAKTQATATKALEDKKPIYISEADAKKMAIFAVDAVNKGMMLGRPLEVLRK